MELVVVSVPMGSVPLGSVPLGSVPLVSISLVSIHARSDINPVNALKNKTLIQTWYFEDGSVVR